MESNRIRFYCGVGLDKASKIVPAAKIEALKIAAVNAFEGVTFVQGQGAWRDDMGQLVMEDVIIIETMDDMTQEEATGHAAEFREILNASCVLMTYERAVQLAFV